MQTLLSWPVPVNMTISDVINTFIIRGLTRIVPRVSLIKDFNPLNAELNPICHLLALLGGATIVVVSRLRVKLKYAYRDMMN